MKVYNSSKRASNLSSAVFVTSFLLLCRHKSSVEGDIRGEKCQISLEMLSIIVYFDSHIVSNESRTSSSIASTSASKSVFLNSNTVRLVKREQLFRYLLRVPNFRWNPPTTSNEDVKAIFYLLKLKMWDFQAFEQNSYYVSLFLLPSDLLQLIFMFIIIRVAAVWVLLGII